MRIPVSIFLVDPDELIHKPIVMVRVPWVGSVFLEWPVTALVRFAQRRIADSPMSGGWIAMDEKLISVSMRKVNAQRA